jgi:D-proline reductase (dithiol) PrdB
VAQTIELSRYCIPFTPFRGRLEEAIIALVSTAGVHRREDPPFQAEGDLSFRAIEGRVTGKDLRVADIHYDHGCVDQDINCVFPVDRLRDLAEERRIGGVAARHFSLGFTQALRQLKEETVPRLLGEIERERPSAVLLTGG